MLPEVVLLMAIVVGVSFTGLVRRRDPGQRGYLLVVGGVLLLTVLAVLRDDPFISVVAVGLGALVVALPWLLDLLVRACFARERLALAVRLAGWRVMLMPGAGLSRQQEILEGLAVLERDGVDGALAHFRRMVQDTDDETELRILHEQIVSMLLYGQRWSEGIAHYEARFPPGYAAQRPPLALGLLRAYGESDKLERAAALLRSVEELLGRDPRAGGVVSQARLTFLAYVGETEPVDAALTEERRRRLGLSAASSALFRGIALSRAGQAELAQAELLRVEDLARPRDDRVVHASRKAIEALPRPAIELPPELGEYVGTVAERLESFLDAAPVVRRTGPLRATPLLLAVLVGGYLLGLAYGGGGPGLLRLGAATPELVRAGGVARLLTGQVVQLDPIVMLLSLYGLWLAGPLVERIHGRGRLLLLALGGGAVGLAVAVAVAPEPAIPLAGASLSTAAVVTGALAILISPRTRLPRPTRRMLALPLLLLVGAIAVSIPRDDGMLLSPVGLLAAALFGIFGGGIVPTRGWLAAVARWLGVGLLLTVPVAVGMVMVDEPVAYAREHRSRRMADGVELRVPESFGVVLEGDDEAGGPWPLLPGLHDLLAQRVGDRVQVVVTPALGTAEGPSALLRIEPSLSHELDEARAAPPPAFAAAYEALTGGDPQVVLRSTTVRRNGRDLGVVIERVVGEGARARAVVLVAAPAQALEHAPALYAEILGEARLAPRR